MAAKLFRRYVWLITTIIQEGNITYEEISEKWKRSALNDKHTALPKRTFARHKDEVSELLGIDIKFRKRDNTYSVSNMDDIQSDEQKDWVLNSFAVINMLQESYQFKDRIIFEKVPSGSEYLTTILEAIKTNHEISFNYQKFGATEMERRSGAPYCMKIDKQRWYVLIHDKGKLKSYALDRITDMSITENTFRLPKEFSAWEYFFYSYGIWVEESKPVETVRIKAFGNQINYLRTLPLHHSQQESPLDDGTSIFEYRIKVDVEFVDELFKLGPKIRVLEPRSLVETFRKRIDEMYEMYNQPMP